MTHDAENYLRLHQSVQDYLKLPRLHAQYLGGLRWSVQEDTLVDAGNHTFAFAEAIAEFVEGFASHGRPIAFGYLLHWMDLFQNHRTLSDPAVKRLQKNFGDAGQNWRFAGAFAALLSDEAPEVVDAPDGAAVGRRLRNRAFPVRWFISQLHDGPEAPSLDPAVFEKDVVRKLAAYSDADMRTWLRTGRGPIRNAARLAQEPPLPRSLARVLASLIDRPRLCGAQTYVTQFVGALTLPPRRFVPQELPVGGYSDIVTRGEVEHLLPTQFALDELEFLRRFAEKELLYFRREEPPAQNRQELVVLLDQGVRTWGDVRLVLVAAALAFGKQAVLRKTPFFMAATSNGGHVIDPTRLDDEDLGRLVEASDLTLNPGLALEQTLEAPGESMRDFVLLTHPRSLRESDVLTASRRLGAHDRLFAVALDGHGQVEVSEIRRGTPIRVRQLRIDFASSQPKPRRRHANGPSGMPWTGAVETIPFPFRLGAEPHITHFDFDHAGAWLLTVSGAGILHLWKLDGTVQEMLPRPCLGQAMKRVLGVVGVAGGFVICGHNGSRLFWAHYDLARRCCTVRDFGDCQHKAVTLEYDPRRHRLTFVGSSPSLVHVVDLVTLAPATETVLDVCASLPSMLTPTSARSIPIAQDPTSTIRHALEKSVYCEFDPHRGAFRLHKSNHESSSFAPIADGKPCFRQAVVTSAQFAGDTLAVASKRADIGASITLLRYPDGAVLREFPIVHEKHRIAQHLISPDGSRIALLRTDQRINVEAVADCTLTPLTTRVGGFTLEARMYVGKYCLMLNLGSKGQFWHLFDWSSGKLEHQYDRTTIPANDPTGTMATLPFPRFVARAPMTAAEPHPLQLVCNEDRERYLTSVKRQLSFILDRFGQVVALDAEERVIAMFIACRDRCAAWMPDGTRFGSLTLSLGHATPGAAEKIGQALLAAEGGTDR